MPLKNLLQLFFLSILISSCNSKGDELKVNLDNPKNVQSTKKRVQSEKNTAISFKKRMGEKVKEAYQFCKEKGLNTKFCILVDMNIHSGKNRFFLHDFEKDSTVHKGLCSHGCCDNPWGQDYSKTNPGFNNIPDSHCSSLGKYKLGKRGYSNWGIHVNYKMHGLDSTNSKAYERFIVFHSWNEVEDKEIFPIGTPEGWGCPAISNKLLKTIDPLLQKSKKDVLFWIYK